MTWPRTPLFRMVAPRELESITRLGRFTNLPQIETKYFTTSVSKAIEFGNIADAFFADGPYTLIETAIQTSLIDWSFNVSVDSGIPTVTLPTRLLRFLDPPVVRSDRVEES